MINPEGNRMDRVGGGGSDIEAVLERARQEEAAARTPIPGPRLKTAKATKISDLDSPVLRVNRKAERRKYSTFNMILLLFGVATATVIYIGHIITVNRLAIDADRLTGEYDELIRIRTQLQAEIDRKSSRERIVGIATSQLGLRPPTGQANWIVLDETLLPEDQRTE
jgi:hypothetical protein